MKNLLKFFLILFMFACIQQDASAWITVNIKYVAGEPDSRHVCVNKGVCHFDIEITFGGIDTGTAGTIQNRKQLDKGAIPAEVEKQKNGKMVMRVKKSALNDEDRSNFFKHRSGKFVVSHDSNVSTKVQKELRLPSQYQVKAGKYDFKETKEYYIITF